MLRSNERREKWFRLSRHLHSLTSLISSQTLGDIHCSFVHHQILISLCWELLAITSWYIKIIKKYCRKTVLIKTFSIGLVIKSWYQSVKVYIHRISLCKLSSIEVKSIHKKSWMTEIVNETSLHSRPTFVQEVSWQLIIICKIHHCKPCRGNIIKNEIVYNLTFYWNCIRFEYL